MLIQTRGHVTNFNSWILEIAPSLQGNKAGPGSEYTPVSLLSYDHSAQVIDHRRRTSDRTHNADLEATVGLGLTHPHVVGTYKYLTRQKQSVRVLSELEIG